MMVSSSKDKPVTMKVSKSAVYLVADAGNLKNS